MRAMKFLLNRFFRFWVFIIVMLAVHAVMLAAVMIFHEDLSADDHSDYLMCKLFALIPMSISTLLHMLFLASHTTGNRFMRSVPFAEELYTKAMPLLSVIVPFVYALLTNAAYAVFILVTGRGIFNISDMLVITAVQCLYLTASGGVILSVNSATTSFVAAYFLPMLFFGAAGFFIDWSTSLNVPLWAAALMLLGGLLVGGAISAATCRIMYLKSDFKERPYPQMYNMTR